MSKKIAKIDFPELEHPGMIRQILDDFLVRFGAQLGLFWVGIIVLLGVLGPFLANSMPIVVVKDGELSSPMLTYLTVSDAMAITIFIAIAVVYFLKRLPLGLRTYYVFFAIVTGLILTGWAGFYNMLLENVEWFYALNENVFGEAWYVLDSNWLAGITVIIGLLILGIAAFELFVRRAAFPMKSKLILMIALAIVTVPWMLHPVFPPTTSDYTEHRMEAKAGSYDYVLWTIVPYSPYDYLEDERSLRADEAMPWPPNSQHWMGTDKVGSDVTSRMIHGCRIAIIVGFISTSIAYVIGVIIGGLMGYFAGWFDMIGMRLVEIISAIPQLFLILALIAFYGRNLYIVLIIMGVLGWGGYAIFIRAEFLKLRKREFVQSAVASGLPLRSILFKHMLPNGIAPSLVSVSFGVAAMVRNESILSFLGLIEAPTWGRLLADALSAGGGFYPWLAIAPGVAIFFTVFAYNLIGEALRDAIDPYTRKSQ